MKDQGSSGLKWLLFLVITVCWTSPAFGNYTLDKCYCYSDNYDANLRAQINAFTSPPTPGPYQYVGVTPRVNNGYDPCLCSDVTLVETVLQVTESSFVSAAANASNHTDLSNRVTTQLNALRPSMNNTAALQNRIISLTATYMNNTASAALFDVDVLLRGRDENLQTAVSQSLRAQLAINNTLPGIGAVATTNMTFTVLKCLTNPPPAPLNGERNWTTGNLASSQAIYYCEPRYTLSSNHTQEIATCSFANANWTGLPNNMLCKADNPKCSSDPPPGPEQSISNWNNYSKDEATVVKYACVDGYSQENISNYISTCKSGNWTSTSTFKCILTGCLDPPPQVPDQGRLDWNRLRDNGTIINYSCNPGYKSITGIYPVVTCTNLTWIGYIEGFDCVDQFATTVPPFEDADDQLNYIYYVTIPSVAGLILFILICLCCTRMDSPLYNICAVKGNMNAGYTKA